MFGRLVNESFDVVIFSSSNGHDAGSVLASASATVGGAGNQFYDIPINFTFNAGSFYTLLWRPTSSNSDWASTLDYYNDSGLPATVGPFSLIDGTEGYAADGFSNFLHPNLRVNGQASTVPAPATLALLGIGWAGMAFGKRRKAA
jgi:hypothetical protein